MTEHGSAGVTASVRGPAATALTTPVLGVYLARSAGFAVVYVLATWVGRLTVLEGANLSMVSPAAGVAAVWFIAQRRPRWRYADILCLAAATIVVNVATGAPAAMAALLVVANLTQALIFSHLFRLWLPELWGAGGAEPICRLPHLWRLLTISAISTACGALTGPTAVWIGSGTYSLAAAEVWLARNTVSMLLISAAGLRFGYLLRACYSAGGTAVRNRLAATPRATWAEYVAVVILSAVAYVIAFGVNHGLPLAFPLIVMTVWAALRLHIAFVILHDLAFGSLAVYFTLRGDGPFAAIDSYASRALVVQLFVGVVAVVGLAVALGREERTRLLRTLHQARVAATEQATIMRAIVDSMREGLAVIDGDGRFLLRNPAAAKLLGDVAGEPSSMADSSFHSLHRTDGTLVDAGDLPYQRALRTGEPQSMDIVVRHAEIADRRVLDVSATVLPRLIGGTRYAVSIFRDVTTERRHRNELAAFAGVAAHDLANPLTTIEGWGEDLPELILSDPERAVDAVGRINRAAARMRILIVDLLDYATARDAPLRPADIDLAAMVTDIAHACADQAASTGAPAPVITLGELHTVHADPVLIRQLLDNLIRNSIKYTDPGTVPRISVATRHTGPVIEVSVTDNGIGIPDGQHHAVFENFHRAHHHAGYAGTGLGLAICKRIAERHGGTIAATDNPDGKGTRIRLTIPALPATRSEHDTRADRAT